MKYVLVIPTQEVESCEPYSCKFYKKYFNNEFEVKTHILQILYGLIRNDWCVEINELLFDNLIEIDSSKNYDKDFYIRVIEQYTNKLNAVDYIFKNYVNITNG